MDKSTAFSKAIENISLTFERNMEAIRPQMIVLFDEVNKKLELQRDNFIQGTMNNGI